jgi:hypothetical protein
MKIRRERVSAAPAQACSPQRSSRVDRDSPAVGAQRQRNFQLPGIRLLARNNFRVVRNRQAIEEPDIAIINRECLGLMAMDWRTEGLNGLL